MTDTAKSTKNTKTITRIKVDSIPTVTKLNSCDNDDLKGMKDLFKKLDAENKGFLDFCQFKRFLNVIDICIPTSDFNNNVYYFNDVLQEMDKVCESITDGSNRDHTKVENTSISNAKRVKIDSVKEVLKDNFNDHFIDSVVKEINKGKRVADPTTVNIDMLTQKLGEFIDLE